MSCQTFPAIVCEPDCCLLYTLTVCPSCYAGCKRVFEVQSTMSAIKPKLKEEPLWIYVKYLRRWWWPSRSCNLTCDVTRTLGTSTRNKSLLKIYGSRLTTHTPLPMCCHCKTKVKCNSPSALTGISEQNRVSFPSLFYS